MARRVLVVEDEIHVGEIYVNFLRQHGFDVVAVDDGTRALSEIATIRPDVILLDLIMPNAVLDGFSLLRQLAASPAADVPIIILSALAESLEPHLSADVAKRLRIASILTKPADLRLLARHIEEVVALSTAM